MWKRKRTHGNPEKPYKKNRVRWDERAKNKMKKGERGKRKKTWSGRKGEYIWRTKGKVVDRNLWANMCEMWGKKVRDRWEQKVRGVMRAGDFFDNSFHFLVQWTWCWATGCVGLHEERRAVAEAPAQEHSKLTDVFSFGFFFSRN